MLQSRPQWALNLQGDWTVVILYRMLQEWVAVVILYRTLRGPRTVVPRRELTTVVLLYTIRRGPNTVVTRAHVRELITVVTLQVRALPKHMV